MFNPWWLRRAFSSPTVKFAVSDELKAMSGHTLEYFLGKRHPNLTKFPLEIMTLVENLLKGYPRYLLKPDVSRLFELNKEACQIKADQILSTLRDDGGEPSVHPDELPRTIMEYGDREAMAYVAWQMPFTYGCIERIFWEIKKRIPDFTPENIFDFGVGPATAILATEQVWKDSLRRVNGVDISEPMLEIAQKMIQGLQLENVLFKRFLSLAAQPKQFDLTIAAFSLGDLPDDGVRKMTIKALWEQTKDILVLVERGTPEGSRVIANARLQILCQGGYVDENGNSIDPINRKDHLHIVAPCPHEGKCPMMGSWCHFAQRIETTKFQMETHHIGKGFVDQKFSYLVLRRGQRPSLSSTIEERSFHWPRIIRRPLKRQGHIINDVCHSDNSFKRIIIPKSQGKQIYYDARKSKWGDLWPHSPKNKIIPLEELTFKRKQVSRRQHNGEHKKER